MLDVPVKTVVASDSGLGSAGAERMMRIADALHEACQPLMALQCRLEIGRMVGTAAGYEEAVREGLAECDRLIASVALLREEFVLGWRICSLALD